MILLVIISGVAPVVLLITALTWMGIFSAFRLQTYRLRQSDHFYAVPRSQVRLFREENANRYVGYQVAHSTVAVCQVIFVCSILVPAIVVLFLAAPFYVRPILPNAWWYGFWSTTATTTVGIVGAVAVPILFQIFMNRFIFFRGRWIVHRFVYALYDYSMIYANALIGFAATISRIALLLVGFVAFFARLDKTLMPGPFGVMWPLDQGFAAYIAMLRMDHRYNNPVVMVFTEILIARLRLYRLTEKRRRRRVHLGASIDEDGRIASRKNLLVGAVSWQRDAEAEAGTAVKESATKAFESLVALGGSMDALFDTSTSNAWRSAQHAGGGPQEEPSTAKARRLTERISNENTLALKHRAGRRERRTRWREAALAALDQKRERGRRARTRWRLLRLLYFNPSLREHRWHAIQARKAQFARAAPARAGLPRFESSSPQFAEFSVSVRPNGPSSLILS